jgi:hypothetical protein
MYYIKTILPGIPELTIPVTITRIYEDGGLDFHGDGIRGVFAHEKVYDENGNEVVPVI